MKIRKFASVVLALVLTSALAGCDHDDVSGSRPEKKHAYVKVSIAEDSFARAVTVTPPARDELSFVLSGKEKSSEEDFVELGSWLSYSEIKNMSSIEVTPGEWQFKLEAFNELGLALTRTIKTSVAYGTNILEFKLQQANEGKGDLNITFTYPSERIKKVTAALYKIDTTPSPTSNVLPAKENNGKATVTYTRTKSSGDYTLYFYLYENESDNWNLDMYSVQVKVAAGCTTDGAVEMTQLSDIYTITYNLNGGEWNDGTTVCNAYTKNSGTLTLPETVSKAGAVFAGWSTNADLTAGPVREITSGSEGNKTFYAIWGKSYSLNCSVQELSSRLNDIINDTVKLQITDSNPLSSELSSSFYNAMAALSANNVKLNLDLSACTGLTECPSLSDCTCLTGITLPEGLTSVGTEAFSGCTELAEISLPDSITSIGKEAFNNCRKLAKIEIPAGLTKIGYGAFSNCRSIERVDVSSLEQWLAIDFSRSHKANPCCDNNAILYVNGKVLEELVIPESVTAIKDYAFFNLNHLEKLTIPATVESIGDEAFAFCMGLEGSALILPNSVTSIGMYAFEFCNFSEVTMPDNLVEIDDGAFENACISKVNVVSLERWLSYKFNGNGSNPCSEGAKLYINDNELTKLTIPGNVQTVGAYAFNGVKLTEVIIPDTVTKIGCSAFAGASENLVMSINGTWLGTNYSAQKIIVSSDHWNVFKANPYYSWERIE